MTKGKFDLSIRRSLHILVGEWLFAGRHWPPRAVRVNRALYALGLTIADQQTFEVTPLGQAVELDVWMLWLGAWEPCDMCTQLKSRGALTEAELDQCFDQLEAGRNINFKLRLLVQDDYRRHFCHRRLH